MLRADKSETSGDLVSTEGPPRNEFVDLHISKEARPT